GHRSGVDDIDGARRLGDTDEHPPPVLANRDVVRVAAQRNLLDHLEARGIDDVQRAVGLVAEIYPSAIRRSRNTVADFYAADLTDDPIRRGVDQVHVVAGRVRLDDAD